MVERTLVSALVIALVGFFSYRWMLGQGWPVHQAQNGVLLLLVLFENVQAGNSRSETGSLFSLSPLRNRFLFVGTIVVQLLHIAAIYTPGLREMLHLEGVSVQQWFVSLGLAATLFIISEVHKVFIRRRPQTAS
jgi:magnesium-transporting ATPase (P-type)